MVYGALMRSARDMDVRAALAAQASSCRQLGSTQYADLLDAMVADHMRGGPIASILAKRTPRPLHDALPLRLLGFIHGLALEGAAPELADRFVSCGGDGGTVDLSSVVRVLERVSDRLDTALSRPVQTNEVGRSVCHLAIAHWLPSLGIEEFDLWEVGTSAGLNLSFDRYAAETSHGVLGHVGSKLTFPKSTFDNAPPTTPAATCVHRCGCDADPIDLERDSLRLASFIWPDQAERRSRLLTAIEITKPLHHLVEKASADDWILDRLRDRTSRTAVIFHSIVWQYMSPDTQIRLRESISTAGASGRSLVWARMEPAGVKADLRADVWIDGSCSRYLLADVGYHGQNFNWLATRLSD